MWSEVMDLVSSPLRTTTVSAAWGPVPIVARMGSQPSLSIRRRSSSSSGSSPHPAIDHLPVPGGTLEVSAGAALVKGAVGDRGAGPLELPAGEGPAAAGDGPGAGIEAPGPAAAPLGPAQPCGHGWNIPRGHDSHDCGLDPAW